MPTPSITSIKSWEFEDVSRRNDKLNVDSDSHAPSLAFPMPSHFSRPPYSMSPNVLIQFFRTVFNKFKSGAHAFPIHFRVRKRHHTSSPSHPSPAAHSQYGPSPRSFRLQVRASTCPFPTPSPPFPTPQLVSGGHCF